MYKTVVAFIVLVALGLGISGYLLVRHYTLATASGPVGPSTCSALLKRDCDAALQSPVSRQFGLPLAGWGVVYYGTLVAIVLLGRFLGDAFRPEAALIAVVFSTAGAALSIVLFVTMALGKAPFCPLCAATHVINLLLLPTCKRLAGRPLGQLVRALGAGVASVLTGRAVTSAAGRVKLLGAFAGALAAALLYQWLFIQEKLHPAAEFDVRHSLAKFAMSPRADIPIGDDDPSLGPSDAWVRVVVFSDFQCPGCRQLAAEMAPMVERFRGRVHVVFKHFPVNKICNPALKEDLHPRACEAAWAAEAARRQDKFWAFHDALFAANLNTDVAVEGVARQVGLDPAQFEADRERDDARAKVKADLELGIRLGVDETPAIFVNGRRAPDVRLQSLQMFIISEIASRSPASTPNVEKTAGDGK
jgi:protein-disulfide isomerase/uncharacterized membrane protein